MSTEPLRLWTVGVIARELGVQLHQIEYVIRSRKYRPIGKAGVANVYSEEQVRRMKKDLEEMEKEKERRR